MKQLLLGLCLLLLAGCQTASKPAATQPDIPDKNRLVVAKRDDPVGLDPADITDAESAQVCRNLYDTLVQYGPDSMDIEPALATSWEVSEDRKVWTFRLREGVTFHDGTAFNAQAVQQNFERQMKPDHPLRYPGNKFSYWTDIWGSPSKLTQVEVVDELTVKLHLSEPMAPFLQNLAMPFFAIVSPTALAEHQVDFFRNPVGTGPFQFVEWQPEQRLVVSANPDYWGGAPALQEVVFKPVKESTSRQLQLEKGAVHLITGLLVENVADLEASPATTVITEPGMNVGFVAINTREKPFDDPRVRQAVNLAIDRHTIVTELYQGLAELANCPLPPALWGREAELSYGYDPVKAKELLAKAGYPEGFSTELVYMTSPRDYFPEPKMMAEVLGSMLGKVGIEAELTAVDWSVYLDEVSRGVYPLALAGWIGDHGDPDNYLAILFDSDNVDLERGGTNLCLYANESVDRWLGQARLASSQEEREPLYRQVQQQIFKDAPWLPMVHAHQTAAHHPALKGFRLHPTGTLWLHPVSWERG